MLCGNFSDDKAVVGAPLFILLEVLFVFLLGMATDAWLSAVTNRQR
jgi:hypothetical protein